MTRPADGPGPPEGRAWELDEAALAQLRALESPRRPRFFVSTLRLFMDQVTEILVELEESLAAGELDRARRASHTLKSTSAMVGALELSAACAALERIARTGDGGGADEALTRVRSGSDSVCEQLEALIAAELDGDGA